MPGAEYAGNDAFGFMSRAEVIKYFDDYEENIACPFAIRLHCLRAPCWSSGRGSAEPRLPKNCTRAEGRSTSPLAALDVCRGGIGAGHQRLAHSDGDVRLRQP